MNLFNLMKYDYNDFLISAENFVNSAKEYQENYKNETIHLTFEEYQNLMKDIENGIRKKCKIKIKNKLNEITDEYHNKILSNEKLSLENVNINTQRYNAMRNVLEELLEEE